MADIDRAMKDLKKVLSRNKNFDKFETGDVIRWVSGGKYSYAAIKTPVGWYTTASTRASYYVGQVLQFDELIEVLSKSNATDIQVATVWEDI